MVCLLLLAPACIRRIDSTLDKFLYLIAWFKVRPTLDNGLDLSFQGLPPRDLSVINPTTLRRRRA